MWVVKRWWGVNILTRAHTQTHSHIYIQHATFCFCQFVDRTEAIGEVTYLRCHAELRSLTLGEYAAQHPVTLADYISIAKVCGSEILLLLFVSGRPTAHTDSLFWFFVVFLFTSHNVLAFSPFIQESKYQISLDKLSAIDNCFCGE